MQGSNVKNRYIGSDFSDFLKEEGIYEEVTEAAIKRTMAFQLKRKIKALSKRSNNRSKKKESIPRLLAL